MLHAMHSARNKAVFKTPAGVVPKVLARLDNENGELRLDLHIRNAVNLKPDQCGAETNLTTELVILDAEHALINLTISEPWTCILDKRERVKKLTLNQRAGKHKHISKRHVRISKKS